MKLCHLSRNIPQGSTSQTIFNPWYRHGGLGTGSWYGVYRVQVQKTLLLGLVYISCVSVISFGDRLHISSLVVLKYGVVVVATYIHGLGFIYAVPGVRVAFQQHWPLYIYSISVCIYPQTPGYPKPPCSCSKPTSGSCNIHCQCNCMYDSAQRAWLMCTEPLSSPIHDILVYTWFSTFN